ncbi:hypothetical protein HK096_006013, partial [Nowakowskiella sp. JEL0078]
EPLFESEEIFYIDFHNFWGWEFHQDHFVANVHQKMRALVEDSPKDLSGLSWSFLRHGNSLPYVYSAPSSSSYQQCANSLAFEHLRPFRKAQKSREANLEILIPSPIIYCDGSLQSVPVNLEIPTFYSYENKSTQSPRNSLQNTICELARNKGELVCLNCRYGFLAFGTDRGNISVFCLMNDKPRLIYEFDSNTMINYLEIVRFNLFEDEYSYSLIVAKNNGRIEYFNLKDHEFHDNNENNRRFKTIAKIKVPINCVKVSHDQKYVAFCGDSNGLWVYPTSEFLTDILRTLQRTNVTMQYMSWSWYLIFYQFILLFLNMNLSDSRFLAVSSDSSNFVMIVDPVSLTVISLIDAGAPTLCITFHPTEPMILAFSNLLGYVHIVELSNELSEESLAKNNVFIKPFREIIIVANTSSNDVDDGWENVSVSDEIIDVTEVFEAGNEHEVVFSHSEVELEQDIENSSSNAASESDEREIENEHDEIVFEIGNYHEAGITQIQGRENIAENAEVDINIDSYAVYNEPVTLDAVNESHIPRIVKRYLQRINGLDWTPDGRYMFIACSDEILIYPTKIIPRLKDLCKIALWQGSGSKGVRELPFYSFDRGELGIRDIFLSEVVGEFIENST